MPDIEPPSQGRVQRALAFDLEVLAQAMRAEPAPCDGCRQRERCTTGLACTAFSLFVVYGTRTRWEAAPREPTSAKFARIFNSTEER